MCVYLQLVNFTIEGKNPAFTAAYMVSDLTDVSMIIIDTVMTPSPLLPSSLPSLHKETNETWCLIHLVSVYY